MTRFISISCSITEKERVNFSGAFIISSPKILSGEAKGGKQGRIQF